MTRLKLKLAGAAFLAVPVLILWAFGGFIGAILEARDGDMVGVVLAIFIPGYGAVITVIKFFAWLF